MSILQNFRQAARHLAQTQCQKRRDDIYLLGYFTDNELRWGPDWRSQESLLISYLKFKPKADGNKKAIEFLQERYPDIKAFNQAWGIDVESYDQITQLKEIPKSQKRQDDEAAFQEQIARQYFHYLPGRHQEIRSQSPDPGLPLRWLRSQTSFARHEGIQLTQYHIIHIVIDHRIINLNEFTILPENRSLSENSLLKQWIRDYPTPRARVKQ